MKTVLADLARHHEWANKVLFKKLSTLPAEFLNQDMESSFRGINPTLFHLLTAETIWWQRIQLRENIVKPEDTITAQFNIMSTEILKNCANWINLVEESNENKLQHVFLYYNSKRILNKQPLYQVLLHLFNHQTYHHGQIITMLRQLKVDKLPATDFIQFIRTKGKV